MVSRSAEREAIVRAAREDGVNPAYALAVASRESNFNPGARSSKTIAGIYQMRGDLRSKYGVGDTLDPYEQTKGWNRFMPDVRKDMSAVLGRDPTDKEAYLGHHFGARRAARTLSMDPSTPVEAIFTPQEMAVNPHFARAGTIGNLNNSVMGDIGQRMARFGGEGSSPAEPADLSSFGSPVLEAGSGPPRSIPRAGNELDDMAYNRPSASAAPELLDLSSFGEPVEQPHPSQQAASIAPLDLSEFGDRV